MNHDLSFANDSDDDDVTHHHDRLIRNVLAQAEVDVHLRKLWLEISRYFAHDRYPLALLTTCPLPLHSSPAARVRDDSLDSGSRALAWSALGARALHAGGRCRRAAGSLRDPAAFSRPAAAARRRRPFAHGSGERSDLAAAPGACP